MKASVTLMKALVYKGPGKKALEDHPKPVITAPTDAIVKVSKTTICGTDLHILKGDVATCKPGRVLGHEGVGIPATFELCQKLVAPGGMIANIGVHGSKVDLHLELLWDRNMTITTRLVDTVSTPMLLEILRSKKIDPKLLITHRFKLDDIVDAYKTFANAVDSKALKVLIEA